MGLYKFQKYLVIFRILVPVVSVGKAKFILGIYFVQKVVVRLDQKKVKTVRVTVI